jgi:hypothetical protein
MEARKDCDDSFVPLLDDAGEDPADPLEISRSERPQKHT